MLADWDPCAGHGDGVNIVFENVRVVTVVVHVDMSVRARNASRRRKLNFQIRLDYVDIDAWCLMHWMAASHLRRDLEF